ncbi:MAG: DUF6512 family protein, partial [Clostridia bacterium]
MKYKSLSNPKKWIIKGIPVLFIVGAIIHFAYDLTGKSPIIGLFTAVNESVWEHMKLVLIPVILWWSLYYYFRGKQYNIDKNKWFTAALIAVLTALISIPMLFYFYTSAFGAELLWVDILILMIALLFGQLQGLHYYKHGEGKNSNAVIAVFAVLILLFM